MQPAWDKLASEAAIQRTAGALQANGMAVMVAENGAAAKAMLLSIIPAGAEVMNMTSVTLDTISAAAMITGSARYQSVKKQLAGMDRKTDGRQMQRLGAAPEWTVGSVHAITEDGHVLIASNTGSQLPAYAYGAEHVIWVVGAQKIVRDTAAGLQRLYEHSLVLESERAKLAYGVAGSAVNKILIVNREGTPGRVTVIIVKEQLGF